MKNVTAWATVGALLLSFGMPVGGYAQARIGVRGGLNLATLGGSDVENASSLTGVNVGGFVDFSLKENLGIQVGAAYSAKGAERTEEGITGRLSVDYVEIPVLLRLTLPTEGRVSTHFLVGPAVSFRAKCEVGLRGPGLGGSFSMDCDEVDGDTKTIDFGAIGGFGIGADLSESLRLIGDISYNLGLTSIDDGDSDAKNRAFTATLGLTFPLG